MKHCRHIYLSPVTPAFAHFVAFRTASAPRCCWPLHPRSIPSHRAPEAIEGGTRPWHDAERTDQLLQDRPVTEPEVPPPARQRLLTRSGWTRHRRPPRRPRLRRPLSSRTMPPREQAGQRRRAPRAGATAHVPVQPARSVGRHMADTFPPGRLQPVDDGTSRPPYLSAQLDVVQATPLHGSRRRALCAFARLRPPPRKPPTAHAPFRRTLYSISHSQL
ncbi:MAG: hypothetical protein J3K34DRAFT_524246 [Monoraphidium minutum]|nr:MAG: hypothetical protein J3K34DRAFT_524246 [Monoraphidium minutum]